MLLECLRSCNEARFLCLLARHVFGLASLWFVRLLVDSWGGLVGVAVWSGLVLRNNILLCLQQFSCLVDWGLQRHLRRVVLWSMLICDKDCSSDSGSYFTSRKWGKLQLLNVMCLPVFFPVLFFISWEGFCAVDSKKMAPSSCLFILLHIGNWWVLVQLMCGSESVFCLAESYVFWCPSFSLPWDSRLHERWRSNYSTVLEIIQILPRTQAGNAIMFSSSITSTFDCFMIGLI